MIRGKQPAHRVVVEKMRHAIACGHWHNGDFVPSERALAESYSVSRPTIRLALDTLAEEGLIHRANGCRPVVHVGHQHEKSGAQWMGVISTCTISQIMAARNDDRSRTVLSALRALDNCGYNVAYLTPWDVTRKWRLPEESYAGLLYIPTGAPPDAIIEEILEGSSIPLVATESVDIAREDAHWVRLNDLEGARIATEYLIENGHRQIVHLTFTDSPAFVERRIKGYSEVMSQAGLDPQIIRLFDFGSQQWNPEVDYTDVLDREMPDDVTAVFAATDVLAKVTHNWASANNKGIPSDLSLVGFDNFSTAEELELTSVAYMSETQGRRGAEVLLQVLRPESAKHIYREQITPKLVIRKSVKRLI